MAMKTDQKQVYVVTVGYKTIEDLVHEGGYNSPDKRINSTNFQDFKGGTVTIYLVDFDSAVTRGEALNQMAAAGFRPASIKEFLALAAQALLVNQPGAKGFVAIGSTWLHKIMGWVMVPSITGVASGSGSARFLNLDHEPWDPGWKFAAVPKK
jgi:hypothetical protein